jgi:uncharacterized protein YkwD
MESFDYSKIEKDFFTEINKLRTDPKCFIPYLEAMIKEFSGNKRKLAENSWLITQEGPDAIKEAIDFLKKQPKLEKFVLDTALTNAAIDHVNDLGPKGITGHVGSDKSTSSERIERYGNWLKTCGENIDYGSETGRECVISLLVDDGVKNRGHRANIFNPEFKCIGIAAGPHKKFNHCLVTPLAGGVDSKSNNTTKKKLIGSTNEKAQSPDKVHSTTAKIIDDIDVSDLISGKLASKTRTKTTTITKNGKKSSITEKITIDNNGRRKTEITEVADDGKIVKSEVKEDFIDLFGKLTLSTKK